MTRSRRDVLLGSALAVAVVGVSFGAGAENLRFMTGPQGGSWYPMGGAIKNVVEEAVPDTSLQVMPGAGIANVKAIDTGKADIAFANSVSTVDAIEGNPPFEEKATNVCHLGTLYPQYFQIVTTADSGIESLDQLKGHGLATQPVGNTGEAITAHLVQAVGLSYDDLAGVDFVSYNESVALLKDGNSEVFTLGTTVPASAIMDAAVPTIGYATHVIARCDLPAETVTGITSGRSSRTKRTSPRSRARSARPPSRRWRPTSACPSSPPLGRSGRSRASSNPVSGARAGQSSRSSARAANRSPPGPRGSLRCGKIRSPGRR